MAADAIIPTFLHSDEQFISHNTHFLKSAFTQWTVEDTISFFETYGISGKEKTLGNYFPTERMPKMLYRYLQHLCRDLDNRSGVMLNVTEVRKTAEGFEVSYEKGGKTTILQAAKVVIATGGLPIPKMGATDFALRFARKHKLEHH